MSILIDWHKAKRRSRRRRSRRAKCENVEMSKMGKSFAAAAHLHWTRSVSLALSFCVFLTFSLRAKARLHLANNRLGLISSKSFHCCRSSPCPPVVPTSSISRLLNALCNILIKKFLCSRFCVLLWAHYAVPLCSTRLDSARFDGALSRKDE